MFLDGIWGKDGTLYWITPEEADNDPEFMEFIGAKKEGLLTLWWELKYWSGKDLLKFLVVLIVFVGKLGFALAKKALTGQRHGWDDEE